MRYRVWDDIPVKLQGIVLQKEKLESIQMFRGIAALMVVVFHFREVLPLNYDNFIGHFIIRGYSGVDMFFVISGFIAYYTIKTSDYNGNYQGLYYFFKRIAKIIPLYYFFTLLSSGHTLESFYETLKSFLFIPIGLGRDGPIYGGARVSQGWTLNYEMYFYILVSVSFLFGKFKWWFTNITLLSLVIAPTLFINLPASYNRMGFNFDNQYISLITNPINLEFILGIFAGYLYSRMNRKINLLWSLIILGTTVGYIVNFYDPFVFTSRITGWAIPASILIVSYLKLEKSGKIKIPSFLIKTGNRSFSIYLVHAGIIGLVTKIADHTFHTYGEEYPFFIGILLFVISLTITWVISGLTYTYIEKIISTKFRNWLLSAPIFRKNEQPKKY